MWEGPDDEGADVVHELHAVDVCREVQWSMRQDVACCPLGSPSTQKEQKGGFNKWVCVQAQVLRPVRWDTMSKQPYKTLWGHLNIIKYLRAIISCFIVEGAMQSTSDTLGGYVEFLIFHVSKTIFKTILGGQQTVFNSLRGRIIGFTGERMSRQLLIVEGVKYLFHYLQDDILGFQPVRISFMLLETRCHLRNSLIMCLSGIFQVL